MKKLLSVIIVALLTLMTGCGTNVATAPTDATEAVGMVTVSIEIDASDILKNYDMLDEALKSEKYVPSDGKILDEVTVSVPEGSDALTVLEKVSDEYDIFTDISDGYAKGINYIYEKSCGEMSGWVYEVNNEMIMDVYTVSEGDLITWKYICDFSSFGE